MDFFYFDADQRRGPVNAAQLRALAANGTITPETTIEAGGRTLPARRIKGLEFAPADPPAVYPVEEPVPEPAPAPVTVFTPGGAFVTDSAPEPAPEPADDKEEKARKRKERARADARGSLDGWVSFLTIIGWIEIIGGVLGGILCFMNAGSNDSFVIAGFSAIIGGLVSAILPLAIASIGRFLLAHHD